MLISSDIPVNFNPIVIGRICSAYGIFGWLKIISFTENVDKIMSYSPWFVKIFSYWCKMKLESWKRHGDNSQFIVKVEKISNRNIAQMFNNHEICIDILQLPPLSSEECYWKNVIGCQVIGISGYNFGEVINLIETGSNDVLVVKKEKIDISSRIILIPFLTTVIKYTDFLNRVIRVAWNPNF